MTNGVFELVKRLTENGAGHGDVESLESRSACAEHGAAVQPEFRPLDDEAVKFGGTIATIFEYLELNFLI